MATLLKNALEQVGQLHKADDDLVDRLNHRFTVILLVTLTAFISSKQFVGEPISCWAPSHFSGSQITYTNSICWLKGTYYLENDRSLIPHRTQNSEFRVAYYQFVPYILLGMAFLFYLPHVFWRCFSRKLGFDLRMIIQDLKEMLKTGNTNKIDQVALHIHLALESYASVRFARRAEVLDRLWQLCGCSHRSRNHLTLLYALVKCLYTINCLAQFYLLSVLLSFPFYSFGTKWFSLAIRKIITRVTYDSQWFPRTVMCDFMVRQLGSNQHWMAIQCNLPINLFNELIFLILWGWLIFLTCLTGVSLLFYIASIVMKLDRGLVRMYLKMNTTRVVKEAEQQRFVTDYLRCDGILVLRILAQNTNDIIMAKLVGVLFRLYSKSGKELDDSDEDDPQTSQTFI